jgi:hypothetical protein
MRQRDRSDQLQVPPHDVRRVLRFLKQGSELTFEFYFNKSTLRIKS